MKQGRKISDKSGKTGPYRGKSIRTNAESKQRIKPEHKNSKPAQKNQPPSGGPSIPVFLEELIAEYITVKTGKPSDDPIFLDRLRQAIIAQKSAYWKDKPGKVVKYGRGYDILAYIAYQLPVYFSQFRSLLQGLYKDAVLPEDLIMLDIGTGPGVVPLATIDLWKQHQKGTLEILAVERSPEHQEAYTFLVNGYAAGDPRITIHPVISEDLTKIADPNRTLISQKVNIISFQNVLAELEHLSVADRASIVRSYTRFLDEKGFLILVEPAELRHATSLRLLQKELIKDDFRIYAPCSFLWGSGCEPKSCWTFKEELPIQPTHQMNLLAGEEDGYRFINTDRKYAYVILTKQPITRCSYRVPRKNRLVRLAHLDRYTGRTISVASIRMSNDIGTRGMHIFKLCDGTCREPVYLILSARNRRPNHAALFSSLYGDPLLITGVQVRRHQQHDAWNLIVGADTRIERAHSPEPNMEKVNIPSKDDIKEDDGPIKSNGLQASGFQTASHSSKHPEKRNKHRTMR